MKKILSLLLVFVLFVTACSGNKEDEAEKSSKNKNVELVGEDGTLNFKKALEKDGSIAYILSNGLNDDTGKPSKESAVESIILNENGKLAVYDTGYDRTSGLYMDKLNDREQKEIIKIAKVLDKDFLSEDIRKIKNHTKEKYDKLKKMKNEEEQKKSNREMVVAQYEEAKKLKYQTPKYYKRDYDKTYYGEDDKPAIFMELVPREFSEKKYKNSETINQFYLEENKGEGFTFTTPLEITNINGKEYIGYKTNDSGDGDVRMVVIEAPKGTKSVSSGLEIKN